jgi:hypothetical protein
MKALAVSRTGRAWLAACGVNPHQFRLLVDLFAALGDRKELFGNIAMDRHALQLGTLTLLLPAAMLALVGFAPMSLVAYETLVLTVSALLVMLLVMTEAANSFLNPGEVSVLAHRPIGGATYLAAKLYYLLALVVRTVMVLTAPAAIVGAFKTGARWYFPITHLTAALLTGLLLALVVCALFGALTRLVPTPRLRGAALWLQLLVTLLPLLASQLGQAARPLIRLVSPVTGAVDWSFFPGRWLLDLALLGQNADRAAINWLLAAVGGTCTLGFVVFGLRALSFGYMTRIVAVTRSVSRRTTRHRRSWLALGIGRVTGSVVGRAGAEFVLRMMPRDWQFRRNMTQGVVSFVLLLPLVWRGLHSPSPFSGSPASAMAILPEFLGILLLLVCSTIGFSDQYKAAWIIRQTAPGRVRSFIRGAMLLLWLVFGALPILVVCALLIPAWGGLDALLFGLFGLAVTALLFALQIFFVDGLPFGSPPRASRNFMIFPMLLFGPAALGAAWFLQARLLFQSRGWTAVATVVIGGLAFAVARRTTAVLAWRARRFDGTGQSDGPAVLELHS